MASALGPSAGLFLPAPRRGQKLPDPLVICLAEGKGFVQAYPTGAGTPGASSNLNVEQVGQTIANAAIIPVSAAGFDLFTQSGGDLIADAAGWYTN